MKKIKIVYACLFVLTALSVQAQVQERGIHFEKGKTWAHIKAQAAHDHKFIFVDCYATWCGPCKMMDRDIYPLSDVGQIANTNFISVKVQMDTSKKDDTFTKSWYADAHALQRKYNVGAFPTYLFLSPEAKLVHQGQGLKEPKEFIRLLKDAINPRMQVYAMMEDFRDGKLKSTELPELAAKLGDIGKQAESKEVARYYIQTSLNKLPEDELMKEENLVFMLSNSTSSKDRIFDLCYRREKDVDRVAGYHSASIFVDKVIDVEMINPKLWSDPVNKQGPLVSQPDWSGLSKMVTAKYNARYGFEALINPRVDWYKYKKDRKELVKVYVDKIEAMVLDSAGKVPSAKVATRLNDVIYDYFFHDTDDKLILEKALMWQKMIIDLTPEDMSNLDTYANLLYKLGRKDEALKEEQIAIKTSKENLQVQINDVEKTGQSATDLFSVEREVIDGMEKTLAKMKAGQPTWVD